MSRYVEEHGGRFGVEPICRTLDVSASAYYQRKTGERSARQREDERLLRRIRELHEANYCAYGYSQSVYLHVVLLCEHPYRSLSLVMASRTDDGEGDPRQTARAGIDFGSFLRNSPTSIRARSA